MVVAVARTPVEKAEELARVRSNQRRSRARRKEYVQELEERVRCCERQGVQATAEVQAAAKKIAIENAYLRQLLQKNGIWDPVLTKPGYIDLLPISAQHLTVQVKPPLAATNMSDQLQGMSPQPSPVAVPGLVGNYDGMSSTPPASLPDDTCGSQQTDPGTTAIGDWSMAPDAPAIEATEFQLPLPSQHTYHGAGMTRKITDMPATSVASFDAAYGAPTFGHPTFAGMLATAYQSEQAAMMWPAVSTHGQEMAGTHSINRTIPQGTSAPVTTSAGGARGTIPSAPFIPPVHDLFAAMHHYHHHRTDHDPPPLRTSHVQ